MRGLGHISFGLERHAVTGDVNYKSDTYHLKPGKAWAQEVLQYLPPHFSTLRRVELRGEKVVLL